MANAMMRVRCLAGKIVVHALVQKCTHSCEKTLIGKWLFVALVIFKQPLDPENVGEERVTANPAVVHDSSCSSVANIRKRVVVADR